MATRLSQYAIEVSEQVAPAGRIAQFAVEDLRQVYTQRARFAQVLVENVGQVSTQSGRLAQYCLEYLWGPPPRGTVIPTDGTTVGHLVATDACCDGVWTSGETPALVWTGDVCPTTAWTLPKCGDN